MTQTPTPGTENHEDGRPPQVLRGYPVVGVLPQMMRDPLQFAARAVRDHQGIVRMNLGLTEVILVGHPEYAQHILRDRAANYTKAGGMWDALRLLGGDGLGTIDGESWLRQRRMMQPLFNRQRLASLPPLITAAVDECLGRWSTAAATGAPFDVEPEMAQITMRAVLKTIFSTGINDTEIAEMNAAIGVAFGYVGLRMWTYFLPGWLPLPGHQRFRTALQLIDRIAYRIIEERRRQTAPVDDLLTLLVQAKDETTGEGMSDLQLRDEVIGFYVAGYETIANALTWALHLLGQHPTVQSKLQAELRQVLGGRTPTFADLPQLAYTKMVFQETLRLYPPAWVIPRRALKADTIGGYTIPADSTLAILFYAIHRDPAVWENPEAFEPTRFADGNIARTRGAYLPFGSGARQCIGSNFALMEGALVLAMLLQRFKVQPWPGHAVEMEGAVALRPRHGVVMRLESLADAASGAAARPGD